MVFSFSAFLWLSLIIFMQFDRSVRAQSSLEKEVDASANPPSGSAPRVAAEPAHPLAPSTSLPLNPRDPRRSKPTQKHSEILRRTSWNLTRASTLCIETSSRPWGSSLTLASSLSFIPTKKAASYCGIQASQNWSVVSFISF